MNLAREPSLFIAGAGGVIGRRLCRLLVADGWVVTGTTRSPARAAELAGLGVRPVVVDVFDEAALREAVRLARPRVVVHQLTDLPHALDPAQMPEARVRNARIRDIGTRHLVAAAVAAGAERLIAQSIAFAYAPGPLPHDESAPLAVDDPALGLTARAVRSLEQQVLAAPLDGLVLRYGKLYGPDTGIDEAPAGGPVHVDAAAAAAYLAVSRGQRGVYNLAEADGTVCSRKAAALLGWQPDLRLDTAGGLIDTASR